MASRAWRVEGRENHGLFALSELIVRFKLFSSLDFSVYFLYYYFANDLGSKFISQDDIVKNLTTIEKWALKDVQKILPRKYGDNLILLKLFGSKARGDSQRYSDLDLLAVVEKDSWQASEQMSDAIFDIIEKYNYELLISLMVLDHNEFDLEKRINTSFYENIEREGVELWKR